MVARTTQMRCAPPAFVGICLVLSFTGRAAAQEDKGTIRVTVADKKTGLAIPCRIHIQDKAGKPQRALGLPFFRDHFVCSGQALFDLPLGEYTCEVERGPEYARFAGSFQSERNKQTILDVRVERLADLSAEGWWSGELHVHRPLADIELLMQAEDL